MASLSVAAWGFARRPAELALAAGVSAVSFAVLPVHLLGWANALTPASVALTTAALTSAVTLGTLASRTGRTNLREATAALVRFGRDAVLIPWRRRSVALLGAVAVFALSLWAAILAYYAPSSAWDGVMYHEPMVGFALQNHGFAWVGYEGADPMLGQVDGYPRVTENLMLFLVVLWDRRLIDVVPSLLMPVLLVASYVLFRRFVPSRLVALGLASGMVLIPGVVLQLRSTYVDITFLTFTAAAAAFVVKRDPAPADVWMAGLSIGLLGGSKVTGLMVAPLIGALGLALFIHAARRRPALLIHLAGGFVLALAVAAPTYVRNWTETQNLVWPSSFEMKTLGIEWEGPLAISNMNVSAAQTIEWLFGPPIPDRQYHDTKDNGYGNIPPFVIPPLALLGLGLAFRRATGGRRDALVLLALTIPLLCTFALSPARYWARLNLQVVLALWVLAAYFVGAKSRRLLAEGVSGALVIGALITLFWSEPAWDVDLARLGRLRAMSAEERAVSHDGIFTLLPTETARARERELGDGDVVVFSGAPFAGLLWNERFSNRLEWIDSKAYRGAAWLEEADRRSAKWAVVEHRSPLVRLLQESVAWEEIGPADSSGRPSHAFRRTSRRDRNTSTARGPIPAHLLPQPDARPTRLLPPALPRARPQPECDRRGALLRDQPAPARTGRRASASRLPPRRGSPTAPADPRICTSSATTSGTPRQADPHPRRLAEATRPHAAAKEPLALLAEPHSSAFR